MRKDFKNLDIYAAFQPANGAESVSYTHLDVYKRQTYFRLKDKNVNDSVLYRNQYLKSPQRNNSWRVGLSFTQPVGKKAVSYTHLVRYSGLGVTYAIEQDYVGL